MKKKTLALALAVILTSGLVLTGCGNSGNETATTGEGTSADANELTEIIVAATPEPHASILNSDVVKESLEADGFKIKVVEYTDYVQPNMATQDGSADANFFQHTPYLNTFNEENKTTLVDVADIHFEPLGIYPGKSAALEDITDGASIAVPNDGSNEARALLLLEKAGWITLKEGVGLEATTKDIVENPKNLKILEVAAEQTAKVLPDVEFSVINGNYALGEGLSADKDALLVEDKESEVATTYPNIIVVKEGNEETEATKALIKAVTSDAAKAFIEEKWQGAVVPLF